MIQSHKLSPSYSKSHIVIKKRSLFIEASLLGVFVTEFSEVGDGYGKGTEIEGSTSAADADGYIDGFYNIKEDYTGGVISYVYDEVNDKLFLGWVVPGDSVAGSVGQINVGRQFEVEPNMYLSVLPTVYKKTGSFS